ncbi:MAG: hypothetical protein R3B41_04110 [Candidatus Doudnabacteria bacterium]
MNKNLKILIYVSSGILLLLVIVAVVLSFSGSSQNQSTNQLQLNTDQGVVKVNDFNTYSEKFENNTYLDTESDYSIYFEDSTDTFYLTLFAQDLEQAITLRSQAENRLLEQLNISATEVCKLNIQVSIPFSSSPGLSGVNYGFSGCEDAINF